MITICKCFYGIDGTSELGKCISAIGTVVIDGVVQPDQENILGHLNIDYSRETVPSEWVDACCASTTPSDLTLADDFAVAIVHYENIVDFKWLKKD